MQDSEIKSTTSAFVFCASDYVGVIGGIEVLRRLGIEIDVIDGSVTDSQMGEDFVQKEFGINAGNARRDGLRLFELIKSAERKELKCRNTHEVSVSFVNNQNTLTSCVFLQKNMKQSIAHIAPVVADYDEAIKFYTEKLDFTLLEDTAKAKQNAG